MLERCRICREEHPATLEEHHVLPRRHGGGDQDLNLLTVCASCHRVLETVYNEAFWEYAMKFLCREFVSFLNELEAEDSFVQLIEAIEIFLDDPKVAPSTKNEFVDAIQVDGLDIHYDFEANLELQT